MSASMNIIASVSRKEVEERRAAREREIERLGQKIRFASGLHKRSLVFNLLCVLGIFVDTPQIRHQWENQ